MDLKQKKCVPCEGGVPKFTREQIEEHLNQINNWEQIENHHIQKEFKFKNYLETLAFVNKVAQIAEQEQHHPNIDFTWGKAKITIFTHAIDGLSENDFILAVKIDSIEL